MNAPRGRPHRRGRVTPRKATEPRVLARRLGGERLPEAEIQRRMDEYLASLPALVAEHGWLIQGVFPTADDPNHAPFCYTIGLAPAHHIELVCVGLGHNLAGSLLNDVAAGPWLADKPLALDVPVDGVLAEHPVMFTELSSRRGVNMARHLYPSVPWRALQMLYPDDSGRFPNDPACVVGVREMQITADLDQRWLA